MNTVTLRSIAIVFACLITSSVAHAQTPETPEAPAQIAPPVPSGVELLPETPPATAPAAWTLDPAHADTVKRCWSASRS